MKKICLYSLLLIIIDQVVKYFVSAKMVLNGSIKIIQDFFNLTFVKNDGAAFSILEGNRIFLIVVAIIALVMIYYFLLRNKKLLKIEIITYSLLISGIIGNLIDRILYGYVIDYLDFKLFNYHFAIFNLADTFIVISCLIILALVIKEELHARVYNRQTK